MSFYTLGQAWNQLVKGGQYYLATKKEWEKGQADDSLCTYNGTSMGGAHSMQQGNTHYFDCGNGQQSFSDWDYVGFPQGGKRRSKKTRKSKRSSKKTLRRRR